MASSHRPDPILCRRSRQVFGKILMICGQGEWSPSPAPVSRQERLLFVSAPRAPSFGGRTVIFAG